MCGEEKFNILVNAMASKGCVNTTSTKNIPSGVIVIPREGMLSDNREERSTLGSPINTVIWRDPPNRPG